MDFLKDYVVLVVLGICLSVGFILKNLLPNDKISRFIPLIMGILGIAINSWINLSFTPETVLGGLVSGLSSTGMYELFKQFIKK